MNRLVAKKGFLYNDIKIKQGTVIKILDCKINELGLYRKLDHGLGWINKQNPIMKLLYEKGKIKNV